MSGINYVTKETLDQMMNELTLLKTKGRAEIARAISEAREKGDLKENAEYDAAKEAQGIHEAKIATLEAAIATSRIVSADAIDTSKVSILCKVTITNMANKKTVTYQLVSETEADLKAGKISVTSPIGKGLLGKQVGDVADVQAPNGVIRFKIDSISV
ncbi:transcription elongation factor GreA [Chitinophaga oryzae]|uniref:Transcription elongation factor GreA n=1 Tax=Chitinophaga oryzae TaxID=2725414 RepID=A0AAE6ZIS2_9BACT|nr:transcription elongation factor GreA [Chitinophaga oryzae]QJB33954.1 transcription elongation factor GreA [Chitinophaga oryzae]QJB40482.1 transcription elongation factor GreA [Chitinophaga oryzae]